MRRLVSGLGLGVGSLVLAPAAARACAVCYGAGSDPMIDGTRWSVVFLLILTYLLLGGGGVLFVLARRSARRGTDGGEARPVSDDATFPQASTRGLV